MANLKAGATIQGHVILHAGNFDPTSYSAMKGAQGTQGVKGQKAVSYTHLTLPTIYSV